MPKTALKTPFRQGTLQDVAKKMLQLSRDGLARRGKHEEPFLEPLQEIADVCTLAADTCVVHTYFVTFVLTFALRNSTLFGALESAV